ncbi:MAG: integrase arm-type DNA-binding domain-containing protein, partial [Alphaproteobacteria bacterium]
MTKLHLTDIAIRQLPFTETGQQRVWDETLPGFGLTVGKGTKTFIVMHGKDRRVTTLGRYPSQTLKTARQEAKKLLANGTTARPPTTLQEALAVFLEESEAQHRFKTTDAHRRYLAGLERYTWQTATRQALRTQHRHTLLAYKAFFNWAVRNELTEKNPLAGERAIKPEPRSRVLSHEELKAVWMYDYRPFSDLVKLLILIGQRRTETSLIVPGWIE